MESLPRYAKNILAFFRELIDRIDAFGKVADGQKAIVNLPKAERETIRQTLDDTYRLIDTTRLCTKTGDR
ncbi:hypothetical protein HYR54_15305 [Candidatus Acetothermia bacterium]|nr:hypothetical protein [Candidatus Acetothermia bacterium]